MTHLDKTFEEITYTGKVIEDREFENCTFKKCDFSDSEFPNNRFIDCTFEACNLSMMKLNGTTLNNAVFTHCKILGVIFTDCHDFLFSVRFENCVLDYASFMRKKMLKTHFIHSSLKEVNFSQANLSNAVFDGTDLSGALFNTTNLTGANFVTAFNYAIDPELNTIKKASFAMQGLPGLLLRHQLKIV
ncbi:hypothetical protein MMC2321_00912 [Chitinophaga sp. MM2321]